MSMIDQLQYEHVRYALCAAVAIGLVCSLLSVVVVLKRMAFIGQGVSHAGFGGLGVATVLGLEAGGAGEYAVVLAFCAATALGVGWLVRSRRVEADTAIGILLVATMAFGVLMYRLRVELQSWPAYYEWVGGLRYSTPWEQLLFGSLLAAGQVGMTWSLVLGAVVIGLCAVMFRQLVCYAFDEQAARVSGVPTRLVENLLLIVLAMVVVVGMRLVGFLLVSALLMIPGATALMLSRRLATVLIGSAVVGLAGSVGGLALSLELGFLSPGPAIVLVLFGVFLVAGGAARLRGQRVL